MIVMSAAMCSWCTRFARPEPAVVRQRQPPGLAASPQCRTTSGSWTHVLEPATHVTLPGSRASPQPTTRPVQPEPSSASVHSRALAGILGSASETGQRPVVSAGSQHDGIAGQAAAGKTTQCPPRRSHAVPGTHWPLFVHGSPTTPPHSGASPPRQKLASSTSHDNAPKRQNHRPSKLGDVPQPSGTVTHGSPGVPRSSPLQSACDTAPGARPEDT